MHSTQTLILFLLASVVEPRILHKPRDFSCGSLFVFGDSLSDDGIEVDEESHGFERASNGPVWPEYVQKLLGCDRYVNYAYSGATSGMDNFYFSNWSGILWQVERFVDQHPIIPDDALVILQSGGNSDFFTGINQTSPVMENIHKAINMLLKSMSSGTLLILNLLDLSSSPGVMSVEDSSNLQSKISRLVAEANTQLTHIIFDSELGVRRRSPSVSIRVIDLNGVVVRAIGHMNTTDPFTHHEKSTNSRSIFNYAYHNLWNPSTFVHHRIASTLVRELQDM